MGVSTFNLCDVTRGDCSTPETYAATSIPVPSQTAHYTSGTEVTDSISSAEVVAVLTLTIEWACASRFLGACTFRHAPGSTSASEA